MCERALEINPKDDEIYVNKGKPFIFNFKWLVL